MTNCRFVNCIDISLICVLLASLSTHFISDLPLLRPEAHVPPIAAGTSVRIINSSDYAEKNTRTEPTNVSVLLHCVFSMYWICYPTIWSHPLCWVTSPFTSSCLLCDSTFFFMKVPFDMSGPTLRTHSVPHSLLLYSVHVKWILICVQNVDKDENTLDYILCTYLCGVVIPGQNSISLLSFQTAFAAILWK